MKMGKYKMKEFGFRVILKKFLKALTNFYLRDVKLVEYKVAERALTHKLAEHIQREFPEYDVDCEYNKVGEGDPKRLGRFMYETQGGRSNTCHRDCDRCRRNKCVIFPDIIVHHRGKSENLLVVEAKTAWSERSRKKDFKKLQGLVNSEEYQYSLGISIVFHNQIEMTKESIRLFSRNQDKIKDID
jgi:hypothetical protein